MSSSFKHALCSVLLAFALAACDSGAADADPRSGAAVRVQIDAARNRVWLLTRDGLALYEPVAPDRVRRVPIPAWHVAGAPYGCLPDLALGPDGEAVVSSDVVPVLWRVDPETLAVTRHELRLDADNDKDVGFTVLRYLPGKATYLAVSGPHGTVWRVDRGLREAHRMLRVVPRESDCGMYTVALVRRLGMLD